MRLFHCLNYNRKLVIFSILVFLLNIKPIAQERVRYEAVDAAIKDHMTEEHVPGFAACIVSDGKISWSNTYGKANIVADTPMSIDGIMNIGSISKTFTTTAAMQLWEKGMIDLKADVNGYLDFEIRNPNHPEVPITIFQILTHTSSIQDGDAYFYSYACGDPTQSLEDWIFSNLNPEGKFYYQGSSYGDWSPGTKSRYANVAFGLLGLIVEKVSGQPFQGYCREHIFKPLGMYNTGWFLSEIDTSKCIRPYAFVTEKNRNDLIEHKRLFPTGTEFVVGNYAANCLYSFPNYPDGLVRTSVRELSYFLAAIMHGGKHNGAQILKKSTIDKLLSLQIKGDDRQGLCWNRRKIAVAGQPVYLWGHNGGDPGISTDMFFNPENNIGMITFQNRGVGGAFKIIEALYLATQE